jgi:hypothetical protein
MTYYVFDIGFDLPYSHAMEHELKEVLTEIVDHLENISVAVGGLERTTTVSEDVLSLTRQQAAKGVRKHLSQLRAKIGALYSGAEISKPQ